MPVSFSQSPYPLTRRRRCQVGLHAVGNASTERRAASLHLYAPPIRSCLAYTGAGGRFVRRDVCFHSVYGELVQRA